MGFSCSVIAKSSAKISSLWKYVFSLSPYVEPRFTACLLILGERRAGLLIVNALDSEWSGLGSSPSRVHCVVFLGKTLVSHWASLFPGV